MGYPFFVNLVYSNLTSVFNILNVIMTQFSKFRQQKHVTLEIEAFGCLKILAISGSFS